MIFPMEYTHLGHDYLDKVNAYQLHSGVDLNYGRPDQDLGKEVKSIANGEVVFARDTGKGWGCLVVINHPDYGIWSRYTHLLDFRVVVGKKVKEGDVIGHCGGTGGNWSPHLHFDIIKKELSSWTKYTSMMSLDKVREYYAEPISYIKNIQDSEGVNDWKKEAAAWAVENGISKSGERPDDPMTRVELWQTLKNYDLLNK